MCIIERAKEIIKIESDEILNLQNYINNDFEDIIKILHSCTGKVIISGMGKSGIIGKKIAATFASTGTPSFFIHPGEAYHGDLGMIEKNDSIILISNSGETDEMLKTVPFLKYNKNIIIAMTGNPNSTLAKHSHYHINININKEACPLQLAPTSSTTATLVMGDVLAVLLMERRGFKSEDFAKFHPGGSLGRRLLTKVNDIMISTIPTCSLDTKFSKIIELISKGLLGLVVVVDNNNKILGVITDGDMTRNLNQHEEKSFEYSAKDIMSIKPYSIHSGSKLKKAQEIMGKHKISSLLVEEDNKLIGVVQIYDIEK